MISNYKKILISLVFLLSSLPLYAVEVAPRISDREIITALTELKMGQENLNQRFDQMQKTVNQRFDQLQKTTDDRFDQLQKTMDIRFNLVQQSINDNSAQMNRRLAFIENLMGIMITAILGLVGFVIWDRKTALRPLEKKLDKLEQDLQHDLELQSPEGSRLTRMIHAFRELAQQDPQIKQTLQSFSLL